MPTKSKKDYYAVLGVARGANDKEIKSAYRKLARKFHPDANAGDPAAEERFKEISEAFAVLSDQEKRQQYDQGGHDAFGAGFDPFAGFDVRTSGMGDLSDLFEMFMGGGAGRRGRRGAVGRRGRDLTHAIRLPFKEAIQGSTVDIQVPRVGVCGTCGGRGSQGASGCASCHGSGTRRESQRVKIRIPAGIEDGGKLRLRGKGDAGSGGAPSGDLFLEVRIDPHPSLNRDGRNLQTDVTIGIGTATLGGRVRVPTLSGSTEIQVPAGVRSGQKLRIRGEGVPAGDDRVAGDLLARIVIQAPTDLDEESRKLIEEFRQRNPDS
ncbi:MAG: DnaJ domain-containing protein [Acidobacteriota bacterium]|nr:DnaJ domain-containing protein [Acidobacteriota bacterium]MDH3785803.1 DnaJ domain-containing protein [Acidobacteriota bacterium]